LQVSTDRDKLLNASSRHLTQRDMQYERSLSRINGSLTAARVRDAQNNRDLFRAVTGSTAVFFILFHAATYFANQFNLTTPFRNFQSGI